MKKVSFLSFFLLLGMLFSCSQPSSPEFQKMENVQFKSASFLNGPSVTLVGDAVFYNPNTLGAQVTEVDMEVFINGKKVTRIKQDVSANMKGKAAFILPLSFEIPLEEIFKDFKPTLGDIFKKRIIEYQLIGNIKVGLGNLELKVPVEYEDEEELKL
jgi:LEA14-like dessication related protein